MKMTKMMTNQQFEIIASAVSDVWNSIGFDSEEFCEDNICAIELCLDADRPEMFARNGEEAKQVLKELYAKHGFSAVCEDLANRIFLV